MKQTSVRITHQRLLELLSYDRDAGLFFWRETRGPRAKGSVAGNATDGVDKALYWRIGLDGRVYYAHILARFYVTGEWPTALVDHWNGNGLDNRYDNLRDATPLVNAHNRDTPQLGVDALPNGRYRARIYAHGKRHRLGCFGSHEEAKAAYLQAKAGLHPTSRTANEVANA